MDRPQTGDETGAYLEVAPNLTSFGSMEYRTATKYGLGVVRQ